jgi:hypothetical protein
MHATSTPTLAQQKPGAYLAFGLAAILAAAIGVGAIVALNGRSVTAPTVGSQTSIEEALAAKNAAEGAFVSLPGSVNGIESGVAAKNALPSVVLSNDQIRAMVERPPFPTLPQDPATNLSDYFGGRSGGNAGEGNTDRVGTSHR